MCAGGIISANPNRRSCGRIADSRRLTASCQRPNPDAPEAPTGPNVSKIRRAILLVGCEQALDAGDLFHAEEYWARAAVDHLTDPHLRGPGSPEPTAPRTNTERPAPPVTRQDSELPGRDHGGGDADS